MRTMGKRGGSAAEFAVILPVLVLLVFGIIEFSLVLYDQAMITNASREGARRGIVFDDPRPTNADIVKCAEDYLKRPDGSGWLLVSFPDSNPTVTVTRAGNNAGDSLTVTVTYPYNFLVLPNVQTLIRAGGVVPSPLVLRAVTMMRLE